MGNQRILLYFTLFFIIYMIWAQWQMQYGEQPQATAPSQRIDQPVTDGGQIDSVDIPEPASVSRSGEARAELPGATVSNTDQNTTINVVTDVLDIQIDTRGGTVRKAVLRDYLVEAGKEDEKVLLLNDGSINYYVAQSGLVSNKADTAPSHNTVFSSERREYRLSEGVDTIEVPLHWQSPNGDQITKTLVFKRGDYVVDVRYDIMAGQAGWTGSDYMQIVRSRPVEGGQSAFIYTYTGGVVYNDEIKYEKYDFDDIAESNLNYQLKGGWLAMIQHYFLAAWVPDSDKNSLYYSRYNRAKDHYTLGARTSAISIEPGQSGQLTSQLVLGPKQQYKLEEIAPGLELTVDYGVLTIIAKPLFWLLNFFHDFFNNWGWAIIFLTITIKLLFYKLSEMSYRSMAKMRKVAPRIQAMKDKFGDDRQAMSKAMMDLYKREKINPMGGCFPILIQMPVFIALYWVLLESVEMRHAPFVLWLDNLTARDPYFILPVIMGVSMWIQQKLNPAPVDPMQQKIFQIMPFAFTIMFAFFPSGLVLYWVVNNILSIAQQYVITKRVENS